ncbi:hypothetical protein GIS00_19045 [Nakamurella sp. YIM 132087]|uniref:WXG100 family type VII secretion target n=1 Tax=Nakamurella alba TaxID=2665158 RepID=A0A7K1FPG7_9ACTN|nr:hypothetical protein [Nakamurella alba]MTD16037.1 hypothetical protein [Nakamurella alba]
MEGISVATDRMVQAGTGVGAVGESLRAEVATMHDLLTDIQVGWQSDEAAPRFAAVMLAHLEQAALLGEALIGHGTTLTGVGTAQAQAETDLATAVPVVP